MHTLSRMRSSLTSEVSPLELRRQSEPCSLATLNDEQVQQLAAASTKHSFVVKGNVWLQPEAHDAVLLVTQGRFRVQRRSKSVSRSGFFQFAYPGDLIGVSRIVQEQPLTETYADGRSAVRDWAHAISMPSSLLSTFFDNNQTFARTLLRELQIAADELAKEIVSLRCESFAERALAQIERRLGQNSGELDWSQADLAQLAGGTRFDVSRELGGLAPLLSWREARGKLIVNDLDAARRQIASRKKPAKGSGSQNW